MKAINLQPIVRQNVQRLHNAVQNLRILGKVAYSLARIAGFPLAGAFIVAFLAACDPVSPECLTSDNCEAVPGDSTFDDAAQHICGPGKNIKGAGAILLSRRRGYNKTKGLSSAGSQPWELDPRHYNGHGATEIWSLSPIRGAICKSAATKVAEGPLPEEVTAELALAQLSGRVSTAMERADSLMQMLVELQGLSRDQQTQRDNLTGRLQQRIEEATISLRSGEDASRLRQAVLRDFESERSSVATWARDQISALGGSVESLQAQLAGVEALAEAATALVQSRTAAQQVVDNREASAEDLVTAWVGYKTAVEDARDAWRRRPRKGTGNGSGSNWGPL